MRKRMLGSEYCVELHRKEAGSRRTRKGNLMGEGDGKKISRGQRGSWLERETRACRMGRGVMGVEKQQRRGHEDAAAGVGRR